MKPLVDLEIPQRKFAALLFDCDGTVADSMPLHKQAWTQALAPWGCRLDDEWFYALAGVPVAKTVEILNTKYGLSMPPDVITREKERYYYALLPTVRPIGSVLRQIELHFGRVPLAVVSGSVRESVHKTLETLQLTDRFDIIVAAEDCARGKPHPDPFLLAAQLLNVPPGDCLVFEDAEMGIKAAIAAGMEWVRVPQPRGYD